MNAPDRATATSRSTSDLERARESVRIAAVGLWARYRRPVRLALSIVGAAALVFILIHPEGRGTDAYSYWSFDPRAPYQAAVGNLDAPVAFRYAPPVALILEPFQALPWPAFLWLYTCVLLAALAWLCRSWTLAAMALYPVLLELSVATSTS